MDLDLREIMEHFLPKTAVEGALRSGKQLTKAEVLEVVRLLNENQVSAIKVAQQRHKNGDFETMQLDVQIEMAKMRDKLWFERQIGERDIEAAVENLHLESDPDFG